VQSQNAQGLKNEANIETIIHQIKEKGLYAFCVQETSLEGNYVQDLKDGMTCIHHRPTKQTCRRGSGGVGIVLSERAVQDWTRVGQEVVKGGGCIAGTTRFILVKLNIIRSKSNSKINLQLASAYCPDSRKRQDEFQDYLGKVKNTVKSVPKNDFIIVGSDLNDATGVATKYHTHTTTTPPTWRALGPRGNARVTEHGCDVVNLLKKNRMKDMDTFYHHNLHDTWLNNFANLNYAHYHLSVRPVGTQKINH
jgi:hypothetical protein